jgi:SAM-dependent methyltransferase
VIRIFLAFLSVAHYNSFTVVREKTRADDPAVCEGSGSYADPELHQRIGHIIRIHSESKEEIRDVVKRALEWKQIGTILDLGCGYGWFEQTFDGPFRFVAGIDLHEENRVAFLREATRLSGKPAFFKMRLPAPIDLASDAFDLIVSSYSLYFFPKILPEVKRLLNSHGTFVVITHSEAMLQEGEEFFQFKNLRKLIRRFSAENGESKLRKYFSRVNTIDFTNSLFFLREDGQDLAAYIDFKKGFIRNDADPGLVKERLMHELEGKGSLRFNKNDRIFLVKK